MDHFLENEMSTHWPPIDSSLVSDIKLSRKGCLEPGSWQALQPPLHTQLISLRTGCALCQDGLLMFKWDENGQGERRQAGPTKVWSMLLVRVQMNDAKWYSPNLLATSQPAIWESNRRNTLAWKMMGLLLASQSRGELTTEWMLETDPLRGDFPHCWWQVRFFFLRGRWAKTHSERRVSVLPITSKKKKKIYLVLIFHLSQRKWPQAHN